ncbi:MAG: 50S ribosomal protein L24 [Candidatus Delongbacteria bacterium]|jgi:large subunit ribosomal protein L24|nr:50S ribosomal protein L24 [Candidatus Delongbacteria bacterium]MDD4204542.1 50S ribosomal protein L24 [Candidatus Delongbacteria bacterium]MDY0017480.1 50S ribosomal protein L24 [Candidatus Delongbacteria bacterium]HXK50103.1 50S ribosomal protein L24 [Clostridiales bacterium]
MKIIRDDKVKVIAGNNKGKIGKVLKVIVDKNKVIVEGVNIVKKHQKPNQMNQQGGIIEKEAPIHVSNVMLVCSNCDKAVRVSKRRTEDGKVERICRSCNKAV